MSKQAIEPMKKRGWVIPLRPRFTPRLRHLFDYTVLAWSGDPPLSWSHLNLNIPPDSDSLERAFARIRQF